MPTTEIGIVRSADQGLTAQSLQVATLDKSGALVVMDFFAKAILDGHGYQLRAGTISVPLVGDVVITDTAAEYAITVASGKVIVPVCQFISINLGTGTLHEYATKSVGAAASGTAFVLLPLKIGGAASVSGGHVAAAGGVTVAAELATTTRRHWSADMPIAQGAYLIDSRWEPLRPPVINGGSSIYTQIAATGTGPSYYANLDVLELGEGQIGA